MGESTANTWVSQQQTHGWVNSKHMGEPTANSGFIWPFSHYLQQNLGAKDKREEKFVLFKQRATYICV